ncbi:hypothetical protein EON65_11650 [archaeon]|nr:MAG: hypothetical protein EON65_11650 [archaeon]
MESISTRLNSFKLSIDGVVFAVRLGYVEQVPELSRQASQIISTIPPTENLSYQQVLTVFASLIECMDLAYCSTAASNDSVVHWEICMRIVTDIFPFEHLMLSDLCKIKMIYMDNLSISIY